MTIVGRPGGGMVDRRVVVRTADGLRARSAALFVQAAARAPVRVVIAKGGDDPVSARSILAVLRLDVRPGEEVVLSAAGDGAERTLAELAVLLAGGADGQAASAPGAGAAGARDAPGRTGR